MASQPNHPGIIPLTGCFIVTFQDGSHNDFTQIKELTEARLRTQFHGPTIQTISLDEENPSNTPSETGISFGKVTVSVGALRNPEPGDYRAKYFDRALSTFEMLLEQQGFNPSRIDQAQPPFERS